VLESKDRTQSGRKGQRYAKLSPELKAEIGRRAAEHCVAATVRLYAIVGKMAAVSVMRMRTGSYAHIITLINFGIP